MSGSDPLWRQCAVWLDKLRLIPARHPSLKPHSRPQDLLNLLRYRLKPNSRPKDLLNLIRYRLKPDSTDLIFSGIDLNLTPDLRIYSILSVRDLNLTPDQRISLKNYL